MANLKNTNNTKKTDEAAASVGFGNYDGKIENAQSNSKTAKYRNNLPQLAEGIFLTDGGLETTLIFHKKLELPHFMAFPLLETEEGVRHLRDYYVPFVSLARDLKVGFVLESVTWRANSDWGEKIGYSENALAELNRQAIDFLRGIRDEFETEKSKIVISGCIGPRGDGYVPTNAMSSAEAENYHRAQIRAFSETAADMVSAFTLNYVEEAIGITRAAKSAKMPVVISFTVETDGKLPSGQTLKEAIEAVDRETDFYPAYYMVNCAHPTHFESVLKQDESWTKRIRGIRANSSRKSHAELDESIELDEGNPAELGQQYRELVGRLKSLNVVGGCCGTDFRHIKEIAGACLQRS
ncbi:MAG TPA: homocysteine S-methyltransferase family protein [Pyrinomonadaceae bacterium]|jgi:S-methylmethionine-dependent homocysteine/selenocysteine methylase